MLRRIVDLPFDEVEALAALARGEGYRFLDRLVDEWRQAGSRFNGPGEQLMAAFQDGRMVAIAGLHRDPYIGDARTGRLRRCYVAPASRRKGIARSLVEALLSGGRNDFDLVRLRVPNEAAARFYETIGFAPTTEPNATHIIRLQERNSAIPKS